MKRKERRSGSEEPSIDLGEINKYLGFHMKRADAAVFQLFSNLAPRGHIVRGEVAILMLAKENPGLSQDAVRRATGLDKSTISLAIGKLQKRKLIRRRGTDDKRVRQIFLTATGRTFLRSMLPVIDRHEREIAARLSERERRDLIRLLVRVFDAASRRGPAA